MRSRLFTIAIMIAITKACSPLFAYDGEVIFDQSSGGHRFQLVRGVVFCDYGFYADSQFVFGAIVREADSTIRFNNNLVNLPIMIWRKFTATGMEQDNYNSAGRIDNTVAIDDTAFAFKMAEAIWNDYNKNRADHVIFEYKDEIGFPCLVTRCPDYYDYEFFVSDVYLFSASVDRQDDEISFYEATELDPADDIILMQWRNFSESGMTQVNYNEYGDSLETITVENTELYFLMAKAIWADYRKTHKETSSR